jgi:DNA polymerase-3 subunit epsilon
MIAHWLARWRSHRRAHGSRWVVVDTETSGLDPARDALLAIGGVAVDDDGVRPGDSFEVVLQHDGASDRANVVLHGIGHEAQRAGTRRAEALAAFAAWADAAPRIAFHADFDRAFIERAANLAGVRLARAPWLDVAPLAAALAHEPARKNRRATLDEWLEAYGIACDTRHNAASDALATAELLLRLRADAARQRVTSLAAMERVARQAKWLGAH